VSISAAFLTVAGSHPRVGVKGGQETRRLVPEKPGQDVLGGRN
jgi:hypothetical protein